MQNIGFLMTRLILASIIMCYVTIIVLKVFRVLMDKLGHVEFEGFVVDFEAG